MFINKAKQNQLGFFPAFLPLISSVVSMGGQALAASKARKAAKSAEKKEALIAAQYAKEEEAALKAAQIRAKPKSTNRTILYVVGGLAVLIIGGVIAYKVMSKKKRGS